VTCEREIPGERPGVVMAHQNGGERDGETRITALISRGVEVGWKGGGSSTIEDQKKKRGHGVREEAKMSKWPRSVNETRSWVRETVCGKVWRVGRESGRLTAEWRHNMITTEGKVRWAEAGRACPSC